MNSNSVINGGGTSNFDLVNQAVGVNQNLSKLISTLGNAFVGKASQGTFTMAAAATKTVTDANIKSTSLVLWTATNAAAGTLEGSAKKLYLSALAAGTSFTVATASGVAAAGTETFSYLIVNIG